MGDISLLTSPSLPARSAWFLFALSLTRKQAMAILRAKHALAPPLWLSAREDFPFFWHMWNDSRDTARRVAGRWRELDAWRAERRGATARLARRTAVPANFACAAFATAFANLRRLRYHQ